MSLPLRWWVRARGEGTLQVASLADGATNAPAAVPVNSPGWTWSQVAIPTQAGSHSLGAIVRLERGRADVDALILGCGDWSTPDPGQSLALPAACFFHAGYTSPDFRGVVLRKDYEPKGIIFYGPKLPLDPGRYSLEIEFDSEAPPGVSLGRFNVSWRGGREGEWSSMIAGRRAVCDFQQTDNAPFSLNVEYHRAADVAIHQVRLTRLGPQNSVMGGAREQ